MTDDYLIHDGGRVSRHRTSPPAFPDQWRPVRIFTDAGLAAHDAEVAAQARADERERIAAAIEAECAYRNGRDRAQWGDLERIVDITFATAARIARTPDPNGDNT